MDDRLIVFTVKSSSQEFGKVFFTKIFFSCSPQKYEMRGKYMSDEKKEEETYSLIFKTLQHPIRRKILRILADKQLAFSEILGILSIDSGHLVYHMENLGELVKHTPD